VVICLACGNCEENRVFTAREMMLGKRDLFKYIECSKCKSLQIAVPPANLGDYYPLNYYSFAGLNGGKLKRYLRGKRLRYALGSVSALGFVLYHFCGPPERGEWIKMVKFELNERILDVGCGSGQCLADLHSAGFKYLAGLDPFAKPQKSSKGFSTHRCHLDEWKEPQDLVMMHHSFEHMPEPAAVLGNVRRILKPDGRLLIRTPVANCFAWRKFGPNWVQLDAPRHLFIPSVDGLSKLAEKAGLKLVDCQFDSTAFQFWGSELYQRDIPLSGIQTNEHFSHSELSEFRQQAIALNKRRDGDSACFLLKKI
jgi:SAM-dependent methyltransferase